MINESWLLTKIKEANRNYNKVFDQNRICHGCEGKLAGYQRSFSLLSDNLSVTEYLVLLEEYAEYCQQELIKCKRQGVDGMFWVGSLLAVRKVIMYYNEMDSRCSE